MTARSQVERPDVARAKRIVVKIGSGVLTQNGSVRSRVAGGIARQIGALVDEGHEVVLVSSGAIAMGAARLGWEHPGRSIPEKQAAAAIGQISISNLWRKCFARYEREVAQLLLTRSGLDERERFLNARRTLVELLKLGAVPVVNENDTVATEEIRFGDNDNLSATVVNLVGADLLVILTDVDGLYQEPPQEGAKPELFGVIERVTASVTRAAGGSESAFGRGGMITKLEAAKSAARSGAATVLCNGTKRDVLLRVAAGAAEGTLFQAGDRMRGHRHWLAFTAKPRGRLLCDAGAVRALGERGRSLLPAGVVGVEGRFGIGDPVECVGPDGTAFARGLTGYSSEDVERIKGASTKQISRVLGYSNGDEVIHRDDFVLLDES
jgi:glutamate 5-kinase